MSKPNPLSRNIITYLGLTIAIASFGIGVVLLLAEVFVEESQPYKDLITYVILPMFIGFGIAIGILGIFVEHRRRKRSGIQEAHLPVFDFNQTKVRREFLLFVGVLAVFFSVSAVATYKAYLFTDSNTFCGAVCHQIMAPEYKAHQDSPHARVPCVDCHIGRGAEWYVRMKFSGLRQVVRTVTNTFELPLKTPLENLRPARETCEECHWPEKFTGTLERVQWHFWKDEANTPSKYHVLMKIGGANPTSGKAEGIHWHVASGAKVRYWAKDDRRLELPWVEVEHPDGTKTVYRNGDVPTPPEAEIRVMDCIDCHNRPTHIFKTPETLLNQALASGSLDVKLPSIKEKGMDILSADYKDLDSAGKAVRESILGAYTAKEGAAYNEKSVNDAVAVLTDIYGRTNFPEHKINWKSYPDNIGHRSFPGCFRCHNGEHKSDSGEVISMDCSTCHEFVSQTHGKDVYTEVEYKSQPFEHPGEDPSVWEGSMCTDCHAP